MTDKTAALVDDALAKVSELGTVGAMKWLANALSQQAEPAYEMDQVAILYAHSLALYLECILADDYSGKWYESALTRLSAYREAMNAIHERESPTFMGEPAIRALQAKE